MSHNLIELLSRRGDRQEETALDVLRRAAEERGEVTDDDRRDAAAVSGLPEATVYGVSTFYDDLVQPRGERDVRVCTGTACWAVAFDGQIRDLEARFGVLLGECSEDGELSLTEAVCLGFCHSSPSFREGDVVDAGEGALERVLAGETRAAPEPEWGSTLAPPVRDEVQSSRPAGLTWEFARKAAGSPKYVVANGDEGDPGSYIDKYLMERNPALLLEGMAIAGYA
ncbi:MAG: NAD(P)H-dependent oxidoreductase subunit E, partial [Gaiellaceae bacterium]